ncbi:MAG: polysaccharide biosynthesis tyrosine autokinase [Planctomycetota bacterium]
MAELTELSSRYQPPVRRTYAEDDGEAFNLFSVIHRQRWLIALLTLIGLAAGIAYALYGTVWYESSAKILINEKSAGLSNQQTRDTVVHEDILANHMELLRSRKIIAEALDANGLMDLDSVQPHLGETNDTVDYVIDHMELVKGGEGSAKTARSLHVSLKHTDADDSKILLTAVLKRYEQFIIDQVEQVMGRANDLVNEAKEEVEADLIAAEEEHLKSRQTAPLFFQGEGSSNVYQDRYRRLQDELLQVEISESTVRTRLERVLQTLEEMEAEDGVDHLDKLALIDSESMSRLGVFAGLQMNVADSPEFRAAMPAKMEEARAQFTHLLELNSEKQRLSALFGPGHPKVQDIDNQITLVKEFLRENEELTAPTNAFGDESLSPEGLLRTYVGFLKHDLASLETRKSELQLLAGDSEKKAKELIEFELRDMVLQKKIDRQQALFDGVVQQLLELDTASGLSGYLYEFLEVPRTGDKVWPNLPIAAMGGLMLGLFAGMFLAVANDVRDGRFRSAAELDEAIGLMSLGMVDRLNSIRQGVSGLMEVETSPNAEAFRLGRTILLPEIRAGRMKTLGFTSPMQGDGKSTMTANFAVSFSQVGLKVLLIDADLRRPSVHRYFSVNREEGLSDVLKGEKQLTDVIKPTDAEGVYVVTAGSTTRAAAELLQADRLDETLEIAKEDFDIVLVDLPPVLAVSDPVIVLPRLDASVLVVRVGRVRRDEVANTMRRVEASGGHLVGHMLNTFGSGKKFDTTGGYFGYYQSDYTRSGPKQSVNGKARTSVPRVPISAADRPE